jgi:hypothetical protein
LSAWFEDYNESHRHKALRMKSPREFTRSLKPRSDRSDRGNSTPLALLSGPSLTTHGGPAKHSRAATASLSSF